MQTPSEHLFCEEELLTWLTTSTVCPITKEILDPNTIKPANRYDINLSDHVYLSDLSISIYIV